MKSRNLLLYIRISVPESKYHTINAHNGEEHKSKCIRILCILW